MEIKYDGMDSIWVKPDKFDIGEWKHITIIDGKLFVDGEEQIGQTTR